MYCFFFFKQKTAYEIYQCDWSSDVCSSDLSKQTGKQYRLPSEAEWEYATRAGTAGSFSFSGPITSSKVNYNANYTYKGSPKGRYRKKTVPVGSLPANPWGLHEVHGNVWEWVQDCQNKTYRGAPTDGSAWLSGDCNWRMIRGGSWSHEPRYGRSAFRGWEFAVIRAWDNAYIRLNYLGFRLARTL